MEAQRSVMNLTGLFILTGIPVVAFALWCDYFERFLKGRVEEKEEVNRPEELYRVRSAGFFIMLFQVLIFFGSTPIRRVHPLIAYPLFLAACLVQLTLQRNLENRILEVTRGEKDEHSLYWQAVRTFFWSLICGLTYVSVILASVILFAFVSVAIKASVPIKLALLVSGMAVGVLGGLCLAFSLGAFFIRRIMAARPLPEGELRQRFTAYFAENKLPLPDFWLVEIPQFHLGSAMMAGFPNGRGLFRPGLFVSKDTIHKLSEDELRSVVMHEISHWKLKHLKSRFTFSTGLVLCSSLITGVTVIASRLAMISEQNQGLVGCVALLICFAVAFHQLAKQVKYQEFSADIHSIEKLGSRLPDLASALRKLDRIHGELPYQRDPGSALLSLGHPATEFRIRVLEKYFEKKAELDKSDTKIDKPDSDQAA